MDYLKDLGFSKRSQFSVKEKNELFNLFLLYAEHVGLYLSYGLSLNSVMFWAIYMSCFVENRMVSIERIKQITNTTSEVAWEFKDCIAP